MTSLSYPLSRLLPAHLKALTIGASHRSDDIEMQAESSAIRTLLGGEDSQRPGDSEVICPITLGTINPSDLYVTLEGKSYSRAALKSWLQDPNHECLPHNNCSAKEEIARLWPNEPGRKKPTFWNKSNTAYVLAASALLFSGGAISEIDFVTMKYTSSSSSSIANQAYQQCYTTGEHWSGSNCVSTTEAAIVAQNRIFNYVAIPLCAVVAGLGATTAVLALVLANRAKNQEKLYIANFRPLTAAEQAQLQSDLWG